MTPPQRPAETSSPSTRILQAWVELEKALREALPVCAIQPPNQPSELLAALRINHQIGPSQEALVLALRETRNRVAHALEEPPHKEADHFEYEVRALKAHLTGGLTGPC